MTVLRRGPIRAAMLTGCGARLVLRLALATGFMAILFLGVAGAWADDEPLSRFFGEFQGTGIAEGEDNDLGISVRSLDVAIEPTKKNGFKVRWSALIREGDDAGPKYRLKLAEATFVPSERPGVYKAVSSSHEERGEWTSWARLSGDGMTVYQLLLDDDGGFQLTSHERTLTESGMALRFVRRRGGGVVRAVTGELEKIAD